MSEYSRLQVTVANIPYAAMVAIGAFIISLAFGHQPWALAAAGAFALYGLAGAVWVMIFICPFCAYYASKGCPCGYGTVAARLVKKGDRECFNAKFKRHIPVIVPLWIIPVIIAGIAMVRGFSWLMLGLTVVFAIVAYVVLPLVSRAHSCSECPQKDDCPWMGKPRKSANVDLQSSK